MLRRLSSRRQLTRVVSVLVVVLGLYRALLGPYIGRFKYRQRLSPPVSEVAQAATAAAVDATGVTALLAVLQRRETRRHLIIHVQYGLGNRLRALASAMSVAAARHMPMLVVWARDAHCNCSFSELFDASTVGRFALLDAPAGPWEAELWAAVQADEATFEAHSYMREDGCGPSAALSRHERPGPPLGTYGLRVPASRVLYVPKAQGALPPGPHVPYVLGTRTRLGRTVRTAHRGTPGAADRAWLAREDPTQHLFVRWVRVRVRVTVMVTGRVTVRVGVRVSEGGPDAASLREVGEG